MSRYEHRQPVSELSVAAMSTRAIAPIVGRSAHTVAYDAAGVQELHISHADVLDAGYPDSLSEPNEDYEPSEPVKVTGMDGRQYNRPEPLMRRSIGGRVQVARCRGRAPGYCPVTRHEDGMPS